MTFVFEKFAGSRQVRIKSFEDLIALKDLPEALWLATACPTQGLKCDPRFLDFLDADRNGRVRARELLDAIDHLAAMLKNPTAVVPGADVLVLDHLSDAAAHLRGAAELVLDNLESADRTRITLDQVRRTTEVFKKVTANGDGIISPGGITEPAVRALAEEMLAYFPGATDKSGERGVDLATIADFEEARAGALAWIDKKQALEVWGADTLPRALLVREAGSKIDAYFLECRLVAAQPGALERLRVPSKEVTASLGDAEKLTRALAALPIAPPDPSGRLDLSKLVRGSSYELLLRLRDQLLRHVLGPDRSDVLHEEDWRRIQAEAAPVLAWHDEAAARPVLALGEARLRSIPSADVERLRAMCEEDLRHGETLAHLGGLERLILYQRWVHTFANNFVSMPNLYRQRQRALFEQGTLILGGREMSLAILVPDRAQHVNLAQDAGMYMLYLEVSGADPEQKIEIAVPVTSGSSDNLWVGKRGIFRSVEGGEFDAVVVQVISQPISLFEALTQPFTRLAGLFTKRLEKMTQRIDQSVDRVAAASPTSVARPGAVVAAPAAPALAAPRPAAPAAPAPQGAPAPAAPGAMGNLLMSASVAFAAIGSSIAFIVSQIQKMITDDPMSLVYSVLVLILVLATPIALLSWIRLRRRNLATVLEAAGWALNDRLRLTRRAGRLFTRRPKPPRGSKLRIQDEVKRRDAHGAT